MRLRLVGISLCRRPGRRFGVENSTFEALQKDSTALQASCLDETQLVMFLLLLNLLILLFGINFVAGATMLEADLEFFGGHASVFDLLQEDLLSVLEGLEYANILKRRVIFRLRGRVLARLVNKMPVATRATGGMRNLLGAHGVVFKR